MKDALLKLLIQVISGQTGLNIREQDRDKFIETVSGRIKSLKLSSPDEYYQFLKEDNKSKAEWQEITNCLTTGETYFFRDRGQFSLLKFSILPELIELRKDKRALRIWSAGCSTGEEAYSIAILVNELIKNPPIPPLVKGGEGGLEDWNIQIIGTDINEDALKKARHGYYRDWSFRMVSEDIKKQWFRKAKEGWRLNKDIIEMVKFESVDLINDDYTDYKSLLHDMDIILCRNVFIYFIPEVVSRVILKLNETLNDGGYLMTGHAELPQQAIANLRPKVFPESVVYKKSSELGVRSEELKSRSQRLEVRSQKLEAKIPQTPSPLVGEGGGEGDISEAKELYNKGNYTLTIEKLGHILLTNPEHFETHCLIGQTYANIGEYEKAEAHLKKAIEIDKFNAEPYYLLAQISRENGRLEDEEEMLKKVIYLNPSHIPAYLEMGIIYEGKGDRDRAFKMRNTALNLLKSLPSDARIEPYTELTAEELIRHVQEMIK
ncbi:MAG TPA: hypothetical protein DCY98_09925 [Nitrospinae bacterium]|nr:hypothetical protein [Nitrospinota bacterium]